MEELPGGLRRVTMPLPSRPGHVHCYLLPVDDGFMLVDTGLGLPDAARAVGRRARAAAGPVSTIFVTHFHPDHLGATADVRDLTGARVVQGRLDAEQSAMTWDERGVVGRTSRAGSARNGVPERGHGGAARSRASCFRPFIRPVLDPELVDDGDRPARLGDRRRPGPRRRAADAAQGRGPDRRRPPARADHADGRALAREPARPARGLPRVAAADDRARARRSPTAATATPSPTRSAGRTSCSPITPSGCASRRPRSAREPRTAYEVSFPLFGDDLRPAARRFAVAETLSHLERLVRDGGAERHELQPNGDVASVSYTAAQ